MPTTDQPTTPEIGPVLAGCWVAIVAPHAAARRALAAPTWAWMTSFLFGLLTLAGVVIGLVVWLDASNAPPVPLGALPLAPHYAEWIAYTKLILALTFVLGPLLAAFIAWLMLPFVHRTGPAGASFLRAYRAAGLYPGPLALATFAWGVSLVVANSAEVQRSDVAIEAKLLVFAVTPLCLHLLARWTRRIMLVVADTPAPPDPPQRCEDCGYDLTHQPQDQRCPECGTDIMRSLVAAQSRPGNAWSRERTHAAWFATAWQVLVRPRVFYRTLPLRTPELWDHAFAIRNYLFILLGAAVWTGILLCYALVQYGPPDANVLWMVTFYVGALVLSGVFGCGFGHRVVGSFIVSVWLVRRALPDFRWAAKVLAYECVFVWVFCVYWGLLVTSFVVCPGWLSWFASRFYFGYVPAPPEMVVLVLGTLALGVVWILRYRVVHRAIRWANF